VRLRRTDCRRGLTVLLAVVAFLAFAGAPQTSAASGGSRHLVVRAIASGGWQALPVRGARVRVMRGGSLIAHGRLGSAGIALLRSRRPATGRLRVVVGGGRVGKRRFDGRMLADIRRYRWPRTIHVDTVTTVAARYRDAHPRLSLKRALRRTRRFFDLPGTYVPGRDGRSDFAFDGRRFLRAARPGGYDAFVGRIVRRMATPRAHRSFAHRSGHGAGASVSALNAGAAVGEVGNLTEAISAGTGFFEVLEKADYVLDFADAVISIAGIGDEAATQAEVQQLSDDLQQIEQSIGAVDTVAEELRRQNARSTYATLVAQAVETQAAVESGEETLHSAALLALQEGCGAASPVGGKCLEVQRMLTGPAGFTDNMAGLLSAPSQLNAYAERIAGDALPKAPGGANGLVQAASELTTSEEKGQLFYTRADSEKLQSAAAYWVTSYAEALALAPTAWGLRGASEETLRSNVEQLEADAGKMPSVLPAAVPPGTVVEMKQGLMWPTEAAAEGTDMPWTWMVENNPWSFNGNVWVSKDGPRVLPILGNPSPAALPFENWLVAGLGHINPMLAAVETRGGQTPGEAVLAQSGIEEGVVIPPYGGRGLEMEYQDIVDGGSGCDMGSGSCYWPVWVGDEATVGNFNRVSPSYHYVYGYFETDKFLDLEWAGQPLYGYDNHGTIYGSDPESNIPNLFFREVGQGECYYYPAPGAPAAGSPGCP
jgi:hypothetical protein